jgi:hypothetical protein
MKLTSPEQYKSYKGEVQIIVRDRAGNIVDTHSEKNAIKIFAKEMLAHRMHYSKVWNHQSTSWESHNIDPLEEFAAKYILIGASFDDDTGEPLDVNDNRYYTYDSLNNVYVPVKPLLGADNQGDLVHPIPIAEPYRPLKKIEAIRYEASYQPSDSPLQDETVRAVNNVLVLETVLRTDEYNGFGTNPSDFFTITEVALAGGRPIDATGACECSPKVLFLEGVGGDADSPILCTTNGGSTITIDNSVSPSDVARIKAGDQIYIVSTDSVGSSNASGGVSFDELDQVQPYYLVVEKSETGRDIVLDRTPTNGSSALSGDIGIYRSSLRLFSQRILTKPFKKTVDFEITIRWLIYFS